MDVGRGGGLGGKFIQNGEWDITEAVAEPYFYPSTYRLGETRGRGGGRRVRGEGV